MIVWDKTGEKLYETGADHGVLYKPDAMGKYKNGVAWNGLISVNESPSGAESTPLYADNIKYVNLLSAEEYASTIEAYMSPKEFDECDGTATIGKGVTIGQQARKLFGFSYRTLIGNDVDGQDHGYKLHLVYGCQASPSEKNHQTVNDSPEAITLSWEVKTTPVNVTGYKPTAHLTIDSTEIDPEKLAIIEKRLYGFDVDDYDASKTYSVGDYAKNGGKTYKCTTEVSSPESFDIDKWELTDDDEATLLLPDEVAAIVAAG